VKPRIPYSRPSISPREVSYATDAATHGWGDRCYEYLERFESGFRAHLGVKYAIATSSCTGALHLGMAAIGVGPGDEVIMADSNWIATAAPVMHLGAKPVFVDICADTWCIDPDQVERAINPRTKAIVAVHLYGNLCDMDRLMEIGERHGIPVIEDSAEAIGSLWHGNRAGSIGKFGAFSFHGTKTVTTGEGGMFVTNDEALYKKVLTLSNHGRATGEPRQFWPEMVGFKYKMSNIQAAIGCAQMERIDELIAEKRRIFDVYRDGLKFAKWISINPELPGTRNGYWMPTVVFDESTRVTREKLLAAFAADNIDARVFFWPLSSTPQFEPIQANRVAWRTAAHAINLPSFHGITGDEQERVLNVIRQAFNG
jgi:perosamine synthetase